MRPATWAAMATLLGVACFVDQAVQGERTGTGEDASAGSSGVGSSGVGPTSTPTSTGPGSTTETTGGSTTEETSASATTPTASTGDVVAQCGNGVEEEGEACDDGDLDDLNGCTRTCKLSPKRIALVAAASAPGLAVLQDPPFSAPCPATDDTTQLLGAIDGNLGGPAPPGWPVSLAGTCRTVEIMAGDGGPRLQLTDGASLAAHGIGPNVGTYESTCPPGSLAVGARGQFYTNDDKTYFVSIALWCSVPQLVETPDGYAVQLSSPMPIDLTPTNTGTSIQQSHCPSGTVATGLDGAVVDSIDYLALPCAHLVVES